MPALRLGGISQRLFPSGLTVLQDDAVDDASSAARLVVAANTQEASGIACITVDQAAKYLKLSAVLGHEQLLAAELTGALVRDETLESPVHFQSISRVCRRATLRLVLVLVCSS
jgi:hypothetical protein